MSWRSEPVGLEPWGRPSLDNQVTSQNLSYVNSKV